MWVGLIYSLSAASGERQHGVRLVYGAVAAVLGFQLVVTTALFHSWRHRRHCGPAPITAAAGLLVLVHNLYGQASPGSRSSIRLAMLALSLTWSYDLNLYHDRLSRQPASPGPDRRPRLRGCCNRADVRTRGQSRRLEDPAVARGDVPVALTARDLRLLRRHGDPRDRSSRNERGMVAQPPRGPARSDDRGGHGSAPELEGAQLGQGEDHQASVRAPLRLPDRMAALHKHGGDHRRGCAPLGERVIKAFADILEAPGGLLLSRDPSGAIATASSWNWPGKHPPADELDQVREFWSALESNGRIIELDGLRNGWASPADCVSLPPQWMLEERRAWIGVPLIHGERLFGLILLAAPDYRRVLDWEDFDLLRTAGRQAASSLAEAHGQEALSNAQRFEEFGQLRLHPPRHQESGQPAFAAVPQCRAACRQSGVPRRHGPRPCAAPSGR